MKKQNWKAIIILFGAGGQPYTPLRTRRGRRINLRAGRYVGTCRASGATGVAIWHRLSASKEEGEVQEERENNPSRTSVSSSIVSIEENRVKIQVPGLPLSSGKEANNK